MLKKETIYYNRVNVYNTDVTYLMFMVNLNQRTKLRDSHCGRGELGCVLLLDAWYKSEKIIRPTKCACVSAWFMSYF